MTCRLPSRHYCILTMFCLYVEHPCLKLCKTRFYSTELKWFLRELNPSPVKSPGIMEFAADIDTYNQCFFCYCSNFVFCVLDFIWDTSLFNKIFTNRQVSKSYFTLKYSFFSTSTTIYTIQEALTPLMFPKHLEPFRKLIVSFLNPRCDLCI